MKGTSVVTPEIIEEVVEQKTKIPQGELSKDESEKLLNMESLLHEKVINQEGAIRYVSNALRRVRSGLHGGDRPIGSFLFLGPTGVGKTETAKALSSVYFGDEIAMSRFDMSEYKGSDALNKLTGSFDKKEQGILANALRDKPFSLLLLDEFEKASKEVLNIFLQILEDGFFTDSFGKKVSAREAMIIATSNAGSGVIWDMVKKGYDPDELNKSVLDSIRKEGVFSPELLNRFDSIVVFHPLSKENLKDIAKLLLLELKSRLKDKDISFIITEDLVSMVVEKGYDPVMGARPMRRVITDLIEQAVAKRIIEGKAGRGSTINFTKSELKKL